MQGLGFAMLVCTGFVCIYYNIIIAWTLHYFFSGFAAELPWANCNEDSSEFCYEGKIFTVDENGTKIHSEDCKEQLCMSPPEDYFTTQMLGFTPNRHKNYTMHDPAATTWDNFGELRWDLVGCLLAAWVIVGASLIKGVQSSGKVVYFTAIFPFVVLFILFCYVVTLDGAGEGVRYYIEPKWEKLSESAIWQDAATQIFYSLGPAFGGLITLASYNKFDNNCHRDAVLIAIANCSTSVFAGFVVFSILGFMAHEAELPVSEVVAGGPALAFVAFPDAVSGMIPSQLWSFLFFLMLVTLGLDSMFTLVETLTTALIDHFKELRPHKEWVVVITCLIGFLFGLSMCCSGGVLMFQLIDNTCSSWNLLLFAFLEVTLVSWFYGTDKFLENIKEMGMNIHPAVEIYWTACWVFITPIILITLIIWNFVDYPEVSYAGYTFPPGVQGLGVLIALSSVIMLPLLLVRQLLRRRAKGKPLGRALLEPTPKWKPAGKLEAAKDLKNPS